MLDRVYSKRTHVAYFDKKFSAIYDSNPDHCAGMAAQIKDDNFGNSFFIMPIADNFT